MTGPVLHSAKAAVVSFWQRHGGLAFFGSAFILLGFLGLSTASIRMLIYLVLAAFLFRYGRDFIAAAIKQSHILKLAGIYLLYSLLSLFWQDEFDSTEALRSLRTVLVIFVFLCFMAWASVVSRGRDKAISRAIQIFNIGAAFVATAAIIMYAYDGFSPGRRLGVHGTTGNPIDAATVFCVVLVILLVWRKHYAAIAGPTGFALWLLPIVCLIILTFSRGPLLAMVLILILVLATTGEKKLALIMGGLTAIVAFFVLSGFLDQVEMIKRADSYRFAIWADALAKIAERPLFGWGIKDVSRFTAISGASGWKSPHNVLIGTLFYGGLVGLALFCGMLAVAFNTGIRLFAKDEVARICVALLALGLVIGCFNIRTIVVNARAEWLIFWFPVGLLIGLELKQKVQSQSGRLVKVDSKLN